MTFLRPEIEAYRPKGYKWTRKDYESRTGPRKQRGKLKLTEKQRTGRKERALASYKAVTSTDIKAHDKVAAIFSRMLPNSHPTRLNDAFDVVHSQYAIEVKTIQKTSRDRPKLTVHPKCMKIKRAYEKRKRLKAVYMLAVDLRGKTPKYYMRDNIGSFYVEYMTRYPNLQSAAAAIKKRFPK